MKCTEFIRAALETSARFTLPLLEDMREHALTFPTARGGNHPLWVLGHYVHSEAQLLTLMTGRPNPYAHWESLFGATTEPTGDASAYPTFHELLRAFQDTRRETLHLLDSLTDDDLDQPAAIRVPEAPADLGTYAGCFTIMILNFLTHRGQVADARRAIGRNVMMV